MKIRQLLSAQHSPLREELLRLGFEALAALPLAQLTSAGTLVPLIREALRRENVERIASRHVLSTIDSVARSLAQGDEKLRVAFGQQAEDALRAIVANGPGPRFGWLRGALDPDDFRQLLAPVVQQLLVQFTAKLPVPGFAAGFGGGPGGAFSGIVGKLGKQVQKSAGQLADVGKSVMSGVARDFSQTATTEFRSALIERLGSAEGIAILARMRARVLEHTLSARLDEVVSDFMRLPRDQVAALSADALDKLRGEAVFERVLGAAIEAVLEQLEQRSLADLLSEAGLLVLAQEQISRALEPGLKALFASEQFDAWLERLWSESAAP